MREIKFRAYDPKAKKMISGRELADLFMLGYGIEDSWMVVKVGAPGIGRPIELMQYTGLKDKNGVEIYEGDIIQFRSVSGKNHQPNKVVEWVENKTYLGWNIGNGSGAVLKEVIGNIYENKELLK